MDTHTHTHTHIHTHTHTHTHMNRTFKHAPMLKRASMDCASDFPLTRGTVCGGVVRVML